MNKFNFTIEDYQEHCDENIGICISCGELSYGVEPDAEHYECEECEKLTVFGSGTLLCRGFYNDSDEEIEEELDVDNLPCGDVSIDDLENLFEDPSPELKL